jgi:hypothetical protein
MALPSIYIYAYLLFFLEALFIYLRGLVKDRIIPSENNESKLYNSTGTTLIQLC